MTVGDALLAFATAFGVSLALTPVVGRVATRLGLVDQPRDRGLSDRPTPQLGGVALLAGVLVAAALWVKITGEVRGILGGAAIIVVVGAIDDAVDLPAPLKLLGQSLAALVPVLAGVVVHNFTLPFIHRVDLGGAAAPVTLLGLVGLMNVVNFSDGIDGLAAGVCTISAATFAIIAFDLGQNAAAVLAALTADTEHFHHRFARIGFSQRRTVLYLYAWTLCLAGLALALRFIPYSDRSGHLHAGWSALMGAFAVIALAASVYLVYVLEILKFKRL